MLPGASVEEMETTVTKPIEDIINTVSGIDELRSIDPGGRVDRHGAVPAVEERRRGRAGSARQGQHDPRRAARRHRSRRSSTSSTPASMPVMTIAVSGRRDFREVTEIARKQIKERLETVSGVGRGQPRRRPDPGDERRRRHRQAGRLRPVGRGRPPGAACGRTWRCPAAASTRARASWCCGRWAGCSTAARVRRPDRRQPQRLSDSRHATSAGPRTRSRSRATLARLDGENAVSLVVQKQSGINTVKVVDDVKDRLEPAQGRAAARHLTPRSSATSRGSSRSRSRKSSSTCCWPRVLVSADDPAVHPRLADDADRHAGHPHVDHPDVRVHEVHGLHAQQHHDARPDPGHRHRDRRRGGRPREHLPAHGRRRHGRAWRRRGRGPGRSPWPCWRPACRWSSSSCRSPSWAASSAGSSRSFGLTVAFAVAMSLFVSFTLTPMLCSRFLKLEPAEAGHGHQPKSKAGFVYRHHRRRLRPGPPGRAAVQVPGRAADDRRHRQHGADRQGHGHVADPARRPERVRGHGHHARRLQPRADRPGCWASSRSGSGSCRGRSTSSPRSARPRAAAPSRARATSPGARSTCG